jgi:flagellar basal-body rod protein FlgG
MRLSVLGVLETQDGYPLRTKDGTTVSVDPVKTVDIDPDGIVRQDGQELAQLDVVNFPDNHLLSKYGRNYFQASGLVDPPAAAPLAGVQQGRLEGANFQTAESAVRLVSIMRQFEALQKAMTIGVDMNKKLIDEVARTS